MKTLYYGGTILPLDGKGTPQSLLVDDGKIQAAGDLDDLRALAKNARCVNLEGKALLPAFLDGHSHITALAQTLGLAQLSGCRSIEEIGCRLRDFREKWKIPAGQWVIGFGYDQNDLKERLHPTAADLDAFLSDCPAMVTHTAEPEGGKIGRLEDGCPNGYLEEAAFTNMGSRIPRDPEASLTNLRRAEEVYFSHGITTIHEGLAREPEWSLLETAASKGLLRGDVAAYIDIKDSAGLLELHR